MAKIKQHRIQNIYKEKINIVDLLYKLITIKF